MKHKSSKKARPLTGYEQFVKELVDGFDEGMREMEALGEVRDTGERRNGEIVWVKVVPS